MATTQRAPGGARVHVQKFGTFLSNMVMPNIGAFIAWGLITALFIEKGWLNWGGSGGLAPDSWVAEIGGWGDFAGGGIVGPMITYLLPLLIGYTGGKMTYEASPARGGVVGAIATMGVIAGTDIPMFMGAMIMGPLGGWSIRRVDALWDGKIKPGFEMLVNNFAAGIWGGILATFGFFVMSPIVKWVADRLSDGIDFLVSNNLLPFTSIIIEPAKVLFLNNALNHGVLTPLGTNEAVENGTSVLFLLEANPAAGLGLLLAISVFGKGMAKASAPGAVIIHFFGGIHEIYFPYVLMKPKLILAMIAGGMTQIFINVVFSSGLRAPAAPGSIIAVLAQTPGGSVVGVLLSVVGGATVTFLVAALILKTDRSEDAEDELVSATARMEALKGKASSVSGALLGSATAAASGPIRSIVFACDAGMGSSAMGASVLRKKVEAAGFNDVTVVNQAISNLSDTYDLVVTHRDLTDRAKQRTGSAVHVSVDNFMNSPRYDEIVELLERTNTDGSHAAASVSAGGAAHAPQKGAATGALLDAESVVLDPATESRDLAITRAGELLVAAGAVDPSYVEAMHARESSVSTYMGNLLAIPHGTNEAKSAIRRSAISFVRYSDGVEWNGKPVKFVIGIAGQGDDHLALLRRIAEVFVDKEQVARLEAARTTGEVLEVLGVVQPA
ncbi:MAG: PTS mannitol transporter subunit IICBA [Nocardioides sp.]|uniref:PTS mannitol transporter subunit IICBA n=1 Tax=Nocardioides sp. TaxID=35761 RepID=UPI000C8B5EC7|nr:PTS mannitol transporter subunit IICBA [Nocardioides sp.]MAS56463.1 PTS mannose transporter subunit IIA [Pimelobacter sp.]MDE0776092.1 PTS mannitol transporter subunit IICBA [Nocardioides sp.]